MNNYPLITGLGFSVPDQVWDNHRLEKIVDTSDAWIQSRTGIVTRHIAGKKETTATVSSARQPSVRRCDLVKTVSPD